MGTRKTRDLPARLERLRQRFERWRGTHKAHSRIPDRLCLRIPPTRPQEPGIRSGPSAQAAPATAHADPVLYVSSARLRQPLLSRGKTGSLNTSCGTSKPPQCRRNSIHSLK